MKISIKAFFVILIFLSVSRHGLANMGFLQKDSLTIKKTESKKTDPREQKIKGSGNKQSGNTGNKTGSIKRVKSARPDMSKSRGARPPDIIRPSGSRIPKGVGRPGGAARPGRR